MAKQAIQRFIRDDKGNAKVVLIDAQTLQPVQNPAEYEIINGTQLPYWEPVQDVSQPDVPSKVQPPAAALNRYIQQSGGDPTAPAVNQAVQTHAATQSPQKAGYFGGTAGATEASTPSSATPGSPASVAGPESPGTETAATPDRPDNYSYGGPKGMFSVEKGNSPVRPDNADYQGPKGLGVKSISAPAPVKAETPTPESSPRSVAAGIAYSNQDAQRNERLNPDVEAKLSDAVTGFFGPGYKADIVSGKGVMKDEHGNPSKKGNHNHPFGTAADFDVIGPDGSKVDSKRMADFGEYAASRGFTGVGGPDAGYMGDGRVHLDTQHKNFASWSVPDRNKLASASWLGATKTERDQPHGIPQPRPGQEVATTVMPDSKVPAANYSPTSVAQGIISGAKESVANKSIQGDPTKVSPAQMAGLGLMTHPRTPDQISRMAAAISGEMSPAQLDALAAGDENAKRELAGIVTTMENRVAKAKSFDAVLDPSQYNSMMKDNMAVTKGNYAKYGQVLRDTIPGFYTGDLKPESYDDTSYHNKSVNPAWGIANTGPYGLKDAKQIGDHTFGSVKDRQNPGTDLSGRATGPTEGGAGRFGAGGLGSGLNSPSESNGSRFGGQGLGGRNSDYSGREGKTSGPGLGLGGKSTSTSNKSSKSDKDKDKSQGPSGGGYGGWGGPR